MAEYTPTTAQVRDCFVDGAAGDFIEEDFDRWLAQHDAELRAEVERLRGVERGWQHDRAEWERERDEARQQLADLRAGIEALLPGETVNVYAGGGNLVSQRRVVDPDRLRTLLAESGEQPGERARCSECGPGYRVGDEGCRHRPAPVVPDVVRELDAVMHHHADRADAAEAEADRLAALLDVAQEDLAAAEAPVVPDGPDVLGRPEGDGPPHLAREWAALSTQQRAEAFAWFTRSLAVVGQDVTVDDVPEQIARYVEATATDLSPSGYRAGIATAVRLIRRWRPEYAAVRPSGQEADRDR